MSGPGARPESCAYSTSSRQAVSARLLSPSSAASLSRWMKTASLGPDPDGSSDISTPLWLGRWSLARGTAITAITRRALPVLFCQAKKHPAAGQNRRHEIRRASMAGASSRTAEYSSLPYPSMTLTYNVGRPLRRRWHFAALSVTFRAAHPLGGPECADRDWRDRGLARRYPQNLANPARAAAH